MFKNCRNSFLLGAAFGNLGRFDTFGDVSSTIAMKACATEDPGLYSWVSIWGHRFPLPADLGTMMTVGFYMVIGFQALPGVILLICRKWGAIGLKLNEFCILLHCIESEAIGDELDEQ